MNRKQKTEMKKYISDSIDLDGRRYRDDEITRLYDLVQNRDKYNGMSKTHHDSKTDKEPYGSWYTRKDETTYTFMSDERGVRINEKQKSSIDGCPEPGHDWDYTKGRDILKFLGKIFD